MFNLKQRLLNYGSILSIVSFVLTTLIMAGVVPMPIGEAVKTLIVSLLNFLVVLGILNNPTSGKGFSDEIPQLIPQATPQAEDAAKAEGEA